MMRFMRGPRACRLSDGAPDRRDRGDGRTRQHTHHLHSGRQRRLPKVVARACFIEMTFFNNIKEPFEEVLRRMDELGGLKTFNHYPIGWRTRWTRRSSGPSRSPALLGHAQQHCHLLAEGYQGQGRDSHAVPSSSSTSCPRSSKPRAFRTCLGLWRQQDLIEGVSMVYAFDDAKAPACHTTQYFEMFANRAVYSDGWSPPPRRSRRRG